MIVAGVDLKSARFGRSRFLAKAGAGLTAAAGALWFPERASAVCPLLGCFAYDMCPSCSGSKCVTAGCYSGFFGCPSGHQCWTTCTGANPGRLYQCCDWGLSGFHGACTNTNNRCICRAYLGQC
jgi:hypothetical protein